MAGDVVVSEAGAEVEGAHLAEGEGAEHQEGEEAASAAEVHLGAGVEGGPAEEAPAEGPAVGVAVIARARLVVLHHAAVAADIQAIVADSKLVIPCTVSFYVACMCWLPPGTGARARAPFFTLSREKRFPVGMSHLRDPFPSRTLAMQRGRQLSAQYALVARLIEL